MKRLTDNDKMTFDKFNGIKMANVPNFWLIEFWGENKAKYEANMLSDRKEEVMVYIEDNFEELS